jgi:cyclic pyranopterin phosphate synthase
MRNVVRRLVQEGKFKQVPLTTLRLKALTACQWECGFCHQEGNFEATAVQLNPELTRIFERCKTELGTTEVHLSGGEPTLHKNLVSLVSTIKRLGLDVKITTNGQANSVLYGELVQAGVKEINFSMHSLDPERLGKTQAPNKPKAWGEEAIARQMCNIAFLREFHPQATIKMNSVVSRDTQDALALTEIAKKMGLKLRLMNDLGMGDVSYRALDEITRQLQAEPVQIKFITGSSSFSIIYQLDGFRFAIKLIRPHVLPTLCDNCQVLAQGECTEFFYGIRLEHTKNGLFFRLCLHRQDSSAVLAPDDFFRSPQLHAFKQEIYRALEF